METSLKSNLIKKRILITGATGYLGSNLAKSLVQDFDLVLLKRKKSNTVRIQNILDRVLTLNIEDGKIDQILEGQKISGVIHCATNYGRDENDLDDTIDANLILPLHLLKYASDHQVEFFINTDTILDKRINYYSLSKSQFKDWLNFFSSKIKAINLELEHFYGKGDDPTKFVSKIIKDLIHNETKSIDLTLGEQKRSFIYIDDVVEAFRILLTNLSLLENGFHTFQVGSSTQISIKEFVTLAKELCGNTNTKLNFGALPYRKNEAMEVHINLEKILNLGWSEKVSLKEGLARTIEFERNHKG